MGKTLSEEEKTKKAWDSNAITPGTPFMTLLAASLRYWVARKMNTDPGWKNVRIRLYLAHKIHIDTALASSHYFRCKRSRRRRA